MVTGFNPSFDACRANACAALRMLSDSQQWSEQWLSLQRRRVERDRAALRGTLEAMRDARDWSDFAEGSQAMLRDYLSASAAIWQDGVAAAMHGAGAWSDSARDTIQQWQQSMSGLQQGAAGGALPMRDWMTAFERAVLPVPAADASSATARESGAPHAG